ncbi:MAG: tetratricopeptide repeat protein [Pseudomonadota bacterium]
MKHLLASVSFALTATVSLGAFAGMDEAMNAYNSGQFESAYEEFEILYGQGDPEAAYYLGRMHHQGEGVPQNFSQALNWYRTAADGGSAEAFFAMGQMYEKGQGSPQDFTRAFESYQGASNRDHMTARKRLAMMHAEGLGTPVDYGEAARLMQTVADTGDPEAEQLLAYLMESGQVPKDVASDADEPAVAAVPAEPLTPAEQMRQRFERALLSVDMGEQPDAEADLIWELDVTEADDGTITLDLLGLNMVGEDAAWEIGDSRTVMTPVGDAIYNTTVELPQETVFLDNKGQSVGGTTLGSQSFNGIYHLDFGQFVTLDAAYDDILVKAEPVGEPAFEASIERAAAVMNMEETAPGKWSGPYTGGLESLAVSIAGEGGMTADHIWFDTDTQGADLAFFSTFQQHVERLQYEMAEDPAAMDQKAIGQMMQQAFAEFRTLIAEHQPLIQSIDFAFGANGTRVVDGDGVLQFAADEMGYGVGLTNLDQPLSTMSINYGHTGLEAATDEEVPDAYLPTEMEVALEFDRLPLEQAMTMVMEMMEGAAADPSTFEEQMEMSLMFLGLGMQQQFVSSGSVFRIKAFNYNSEALDATMVGEVAASAESPYGAVGAIDLQIVGLDQAVKDLSADAGKDPDAQDMVTTLTMMQSMGARTEVDGRSVHDYAFNFTPEGQILLNGNDMGPMIGGMMGEEPQP